VSDTEGRTWGDVVREVAAEHDIDPAALNGQPILDHILWEHTPFPLVGSDKATPFLHRYFEGEANEYGCNAYDDAVLPTPEQGEGGQ
jgi:hypothetical protein